LTLSPTLRKSACAVTVDVADSLQMDSYPGPLGQVLTNLINNALIHGFPENQTGTIAITARMEDGDRAVLQVQDDGRGIQSADLPHVFEPFFTTRMGQGGSGLGLHIVHNLVTSVLGGTISARSEPGHGANFQLTIPCTAADQQDNQPIAN
jgi:signal transduction histidine kinase